MLGMSLVTSDVAIKCNLAVSLIEQQQAYLYLLGIEILGASENIGLGDTL